MRRVCEVLRPNDPLRELEGPFSVPRRRSATRKLAMIGTDSSERPGNRDCGLPGSPSLHPCRIPSPVREGGGLCEFLIDAWRPLDRRGGGQRSGTAAFPDRPCIGIA